MSQLTFWGIAETDSGNAKRQALTSFGANSSTSTPRSMGVTECGTDGLAIEGRTIHNSGSDTAATADSEALPAYTSRRRLHLQNLSTTITLRYWWGAFSSVKFELDPRETLTLTGADCPADALNVDTASGSAAYVVADW